MCGRYGFFPGENFKKRYDISGDVPDLKASYNVAPGLQMPVVVCSGKKEVTLMKWGLIPHWAKDPSIGYKMINARAESLAEKPSFRESFMRKRCLVPANGFFEWKKTAGEKIPFYIRLKDQELLSFAGLYDSWSDEDGKVVKSYSIITTDANSILAPIHNRMPVILPEEKEDAWLDQELQDSRILQSFLVPYKSSDMVVYPVSSDVNRTDRNNEDLIKPLNNLPPEQGNLF